MAGKKTGYQPKKSKRIRPVGKGNKRLFGFLVLVMLCVLFCVSFTYLKQKAQREQAAKLAEIRRLERLIAEETERTESISNYKAYIQTTAYIEEIAREVLGLVYKNEVLFIPENSDGD